MRYLFSSITLIFLIQSNSVFAWGKFGHVVVCEIAYRNLNVEVRKEVNRLLSVDGEYTSFNQACLEADEMPRTSPNSHFSNYGRDVLSVNQDGCPGDVPCVISAIKQDSSILADTSKTDTERARAMILLGHWVGDIHQPLHISYADDRGGNSIDKRGKCSESNLHSVWDNCIIDQKILPGNWMQKQFGWSRFTRAYRAADSLTAEISESNKSEWINSEPWQWASESYEITINPDVLYCTQRNHSCWYEPNNKRLDDGEEIKTVQITDEYLEKFSPVVKQRLKQAGVRLASLINESLKY
jgi:hypothetical protein